VGVWSVKAVCKIHIKPVKTQGHQSTTTTTTKIAAPVSWKYRPLCYSSVDVFGWALMHLVVAVAVDMGRMTEQLPSSETVSSALSCS